MTTRTMINCTGANAAKVATLVGSPPLVAWYGTGTPGTEWTAGELALYPRSRSVEVDQGYGAIRPTGATVRDVESGAWTVDEAVNLAGWNVPCPTIYCDVDTLPAVIAAGWRDDVWLAHPGWSGNAAPVYQGVNVVAVQNVFAADYESSVVFDQYWPDKPPAPDPATPMSVTAIGLVADLAFGEVPGTDHYVIKYTATGHPGTPQVIRIAGDDVKDTYHMSDVVLMPGPGGEIEIGAIVKGKTVIIGTKTV